MSASLAADPAAWDAFVASTPLAPYLQATPWAAVKAANGWHSERIVVEGTGGPVGAQVLLHRIGPGPWAVGYAPRGPVAVRMDEDGVRRWTEALRAMARRRRLSHVVIDPELEAGGPETGWLLGCGWRTAASPQPVRSRWIDLSLPEAVLWGDLRSKWRQYVQKARRGGISIVERDATGLDAFYAIYVETARRAGFPYRSAATYRTVYEAFAERGAARLLFACDTRGEPVASLMLVGWGRRVVEPYGGMTASGAESRANYLLKWEAIRTSREGGFGCYDLWGLSHAGIEQFKAGFGGRAVEYVGGFELPVRPLVQRGVGVAQAVRVGIWERRVAREARSARTADSDGP
jgi:peptidoglycan pentaglycine glycine transferase (the first glycine)